jgi:hypothetical protein
MSTWESLARTSGNPNDSKEADISSKIGLSAAKAGFSMVWVIIHLSIVKSRVQGHTESLRNTTIIVSTLFAIRLLFAIGLASRHDEFARLHVAS